MNAVLYKDAKEIIDYSINAVLPDEAVKRALKGKKFAGRVFLVAAGKAAWQMASAACNCIENSVEHGIVITKYGHIKGELPHIDCYEAGHPVPDKNSFSATSAAIDLVKNLLPDDTVLFLLSGGGSALFEQPLIPGDELQNITKQLLSCAADIVEINTVRKRLSGVKGGRFALACAPASVYAIILSDIVGDPLDMIASGPVTPDKSTCAQANAIVQKYGLTLSATAKKLLTEETPKTLNNVTTQITGSVRELCAAAAAKCRELGYEPIILTDRLCCQAKEAGSFFASVVQTHCDSGKSTAFIAGGETVVKLTGNGKGGRNQELALSAATGISGIKNTAVFSIGSDGTDGPTDAAGGYVDDETASTLKANGVDIFDILEHNNAYFALKQTDGLIFTGPTGTNVNDVAVALIKR